MFLSFLAVMGIIFLVTLLMHLLNLFLCLLIIHNLGICEKIRTKSMWALGGRCDIGEIPMSCGEMREEACYSKSDGYEKEIRDIEARGTNN